MLQDLSTAIPLGFFLAFLVGPVFFVLLETAAIKGFRAALLFDIGVITADILFILIAYFSTNKLLNELKDDPGLFIFGGMLLATYGIISFLRAKSRDLDAEEEHPTVIMSRRNYLGMVIKGFLLNFINIGVLGFWLVLLISAGPTMDMNPDRLIFFFSVILLTYLIVDIIKILVAKKLRSKLTPSRVARIKKGISVVLFIFGLVFIVKGAFPSEISKIEEKFEQFTPETPFQEQEKALDSVH
ncbi:LysE family translocator [Flavimarina sp. Hel_I_48]|uniref:LysE family translocator n=1 Tax=Flavimarina sp. Hel_I_48 TaxID=1392488 RepID=UPI0004DF7895|nr:LysE family transporter [Flavimarina sp. Hel_I_48]